MKDFLFIGLPIILFHLNNNNLGTCIKLFYKFDENAFTLMSLTERSRLVFFDKEISLFQAEFTSKEEALEKMADLLTAENLVEVDFKQEILVRESTFPTGLPTLPFGVAIPHTDPDKVKEQQIAFASLKKPVTFNMMGSSGEEVDVRIIFMLALKNGEEHLGMLQRLIEIFQNQSIIKSLGNCSNQDELMTVLTSAGLE
jgi:galactitol PTS system EIIA component